MSKNIQYILQIIILVFAAKTASAQDINFTQFYKAPLVLNPANTGNFDGDWRISNIYRSQWAGFGIPYTTFAVGYDMPLNYNDHKISAGVMVLSDKAGDGSLMRNGLYLSSSYFFKQGRHTLIAGLQTGFVMQAINQAALTFPDQYDRNVGYHNPANPNGESFAGEQVFYADVNAGIYYKKRRGRYKPEIGLTLYHLNLPNQSFYQQSSDRAPIRYTGYIAAWTEIAVGISICPKLLYSGQASAHYLMLGGLLQYSFSSFDHIIQNIYGGIFMKNDAANLQKAVSVTGGIKFRDFDIGFGYDMNIIGLTNSMQNASGFEITLIYTSPSYFHEKSTLPCDRM